MVMKGDCLQRGELQRGVNGQQRGVSDFSFLELSFEFRVFFAFEESRPKGVLKYIRI